MLRTTAAFAVLAGALLSVLSLWPGSASARIVEVGKAADPASPPSCPARPCSAVTRTTGYQAKVGPDRALYTIPEDGKIVAFTLDLGNPGPTQIEFFDDTYKGAASAGITVLREGKRLRSRVVTKSPIYQLQPYFGQTVQIPLPHALNVKKGYRLALTVPTWAPALAINLGNDTSWRAARPMDQCDNLLTQTAQTDLKSITQYRCLYKTARLTYSATLITNPNPRPAEAEPPSGRRR